MGKLNGDHSPTPIQAKLNVFFFWKVIIILQLYLRRLCILTLSNKGVAKTKYRIFPQFVQSSQTRFALPIPRFLIRSCSSLPSHVWGGPPTFSSCPYHDTIQSYVLFFFNLIPSVCASFYSTNSTTSAPSVMPKHSNTS